MSITSTNIYEISMWKYTLRSKGDLKPSIPKVYVMINCDHQLYKILQSFRRLEKSICLPMGDYQDSAN